MGTGTAPRGEYAIVGGREAKRRLNLLAEITHSTTLSLLHRAGVAAGQRCLDLGCGGGHVSIELAKLVGPTGSVVGIDLDAELIALAKLDARAAGVACEFLVGDCRDARPGPYDVCYARFLLSHLSDPEQTVKRFAELLAPGGNLVVEDIDFTGRFSYPDDPAYERFDTLYRRAVHLTGGDADLGRKLPHLLQAAGLQQVGVNIVHPAHLAGPHKQISYQTMEQIRPTLLRSGLTTDSEIDQILADMLASANDPTTLIAMPRIVQAWGLRTPRVTNASRTSR